MPGDMDGESPELFLGGDVLRDRRPVRSAYGSRAPLDAVLGQEAFGMRCSSTNGPGGWRGVARPFALDTQIDGEEAAGFGIWRCILAFQMSVGTQMLFFLPRPSGGLRTGTRWSVVCLGMDWAPRIQSSPRWRQQYDRCQGRHWR